MNSADINSTPINARSLLQYGFLALPVAFAGFPLYVLAPDFYATRHGLPLGLLGALLLAIRLFDAVQDPFIGWLTDRLQGRFLTLLTSCGAALCLAVLGLFNVVIFSPAIWFSLCMLVAVSAYSALVITLGSQATLWTADKHAQTRIAGVREAFGLIGLVVAVSIPVPLSWVVEPGKVYLWYVAILALLMVAGIAGFRALLANSPARARSTQTVATSPLAALRALPAESLRLLAVHGLGMLASSIPAVLVIFYVRDLLGAEHLTGVFLLLYFLSGAVAMPLWKYVSVRVGKYRAWSLSSLLAVVGFVGAWLLDSGDVWPYAFVCVVSGLALGADLTLPPSILADHVHAHDNSAFSGTHYACLAFIGKISLALASAVALPVLDLAGFKPQAENSDLALATLSFAYALVPSVLKLAAVVLLYFFFMRSQSGGNHEAVPDNRHYRSSHHA